MSAIGDAIRAPLTTSADILRWATNKVDEKVVSPVANRIVNSYANPYVLSYLIWERIKQMTPQRARDVSRIVSSALRNAVGVLGAEKAQEFKHVGQKLQDEFIVASISPQGREVILNGVATVSKVAQALNTPETKIATRQVAETIQSLIDFFASQEGRKIISTAGEVFNKACEVAASPESSILLAEVATNICHAVEIETIRRESDAAAQHKQEKSHEEEEGMEEEEEEEEVTIKKEEGAHVEHHKDTTSPTSSSAETSALTDIESLVLDAEPRVRGKKKEDKKEYRSAKIEKEVLLKMGVDPALTGEIQRILDRILEEDELSRHAASVDAVKEDEEEEEEEEECMDVNEHSSISRAFGIKTSELPPPSLSVSVKQEQKNEPEEDVIIPQWHLETTREALRCRHRRQEEDMQVRDTYEEQSRQMAQLLNKRRRALDTAAVGPRGHTNQVEMTALDVVACRAISQMIIYCFGFLLLMFCYNAAKTIIPGYS